jgi:subtilisin family serine protease
MKSALLNVSLLEKLLQKKTAESGFSAEAGAGQSEKGAEPQNTPLVATAMAGYGFQTAFSRVNTINVNSASGQAGASETSGDDIEGVQAYVLTPATEISFQTLQSSADLSGLNDAADAAVNTFAPHSDGILVQFTAGVTAAEKSELLASVGGLINDYLHLDDGISGDLAVVSIGSQNLDDILTALGSSRFVQYAETNRVLDAQLASNDSYYTNGSMWGMYGDLTSPANVYGSQAGEAWAAGIVGKSTTVIGDIDTGIDYTHADLYLNVWLNQGELPSGMALSDTNADGLITFRDLNASANAGFVSDFNFNGRIDAGDLLADSNWANRLDNDGNGYIDDLIGWDFVNNDNNPYDDNNHGTHTAGTIGATGGNGTGVAGVNWNVEIMGLKFLSSTGGGSIANAVKALDYYTAAAAKDQSAGWSSEFIGTNNSWGGGGFSQAMQDAITRTARQDLLFIAAAGNGGSDGIGDNNDITANYPSNYSTMSTAGYEAVVAVSALASNGALASYSNYGATTVDLGAPGSGIWSTVAGGGYASYSGTSMATPHVTGALALEASLHPEYSAAQLRNALLSTTVYTSSLARKTVSGGRLDVGSLVNAAPPASNTGVVLYGTNRNDVIVGTSYDDTLAGVLQSGSNLGKGTIDQLTGGLGSDLFILGDSRGRFYDDGNNKLSGKTDYAVIKDFASDDLIQLKSGNYWLSNTTVNGLTGNGLYVDTNVNRLFDSTDEMIALVQGAGAMSITASNIKWV